MRARDQFLAGAGLAADQHRQSVAVTHAIDAIQALHHSAAADHLVRYAEFLFQTVGFGGQRFEAEGVGERRRPDGRKGGHDLEVQPVEHGVRIGGRQVEGADGALLIDQGNGEGACDSGIRAAAGRAALPRGTDEDRGSLRQDLLDDPGFGAVGATPARCLV